MVGDDTRIIPGLGPVSGRAELVAFLEMLRIVRVRVGALVEVGRTLGGDPGREAGRRVRRDLSKGLLSPERIVTVVYTSLARAE